jgi:glycosyltransferase involved in cell wall biosynthesis
MVIAQMNNLTSIPFSSIVPSRAHISFSVIMASYNRKYCIDQAIQSVLSQNYVDFELLIVDDGSTDGTLDYVRAIYPNEIGKGNIRLIPVTKVGVCEARNIGLNHAKYDWVCYLDTDNRMMPFYFEIFNQCILANSEYQCFYAKMRNRTSGEVVGRPFSFFELVRGNFIDIGTFVHSKALYSELGGEDINLVRLEDWDQIIRYTALHKPYFIDAIVLDYNDVPGDRSSDKPDYEDNHRRLMAKDILINLGFLAENLYPPESLQWAVKHLLKISFNKIKKLSTGHFFLR